MSRFICCIVAVCALVSPPARGQRVRPDGSVNLPYRTTQADAQGNYTFIYQGGSFQQQGQFPQYSEGGVLTVNGNQPMPNNNVAKLGPGGEVVMENMPT